MVKMKEKPLRSLVEHELSVEKNWKMNCFFYVLQHVADDGSSVIYIDHISPGESKSLRESLKTIGSVKNFLPLLNKVNKLYPVSLKQLYHKVLPAARVLFLCLPAFYRIWFPLWCWPARGVVQSSENTTCSHHPQEENRAQQLHVILLVWEVVKQTIQ